MATIPLNINNAIPPYAISVRKTGEGYERFRGWSNNTLVFEPATDGVDAHYNVIVIDSANPPCTIQGGFNLLCGGGSCALPQFSAKLVQPYCSYPANVPQNGIMELKGVVNSVRYKVCYNGNCGDCTQSDGVITGDTNVQLLTSGASQSGHVRVFANSGCECFLDVPFSISNPDCTQKKISLLNIDYRTIVTSDSQNRCTDVVTNDFEIYMVLNTPGVAENGQRAMIRGGAQRNVPNGNDTPNVFITAALDISYGPGAFYRWGINFSYLRGKYPGIQNFDFEVYAKKVKSTKQTSLDPQYNYFSGVSMTYLAAQTECSSGYKNATDQYRQPYETTQSGLKTPQGSSFSGTTTNFKLIDRFTVDSARVNISDVNNPVTWTNVP